jgi:predicted cobalt transporter CbtA
MIVITTALYAGTKEEAANQQNCFYAESPAEAVHIIEEGATAFIPVDGWEETAEAVLKRWATQEQIEVSIYFARTGLLPEEGFMP